MPCELLIKTTNPRKFLLEYQLHRKRTGVLTNIFLKMTQFTIQYKHKAKATKKKLLSEFVWSLKAFHYFESYLSQDLP